jgi:hypothetical protein
MAFEARRALLMGSPEKCGSASASVRQALAEAASSGSTTLTTFCASAACVNHRAPGGTPLINCKHSRFSTLLYFIADKRICQARVPAAHTAAAHTAAAHTAAAHTAAATT